MEFNLDLQGFDIFQLAASPYPEAILGLGGLLAILISLTYARDKGKAMYYLGAALGMVVGALMLILVYILYVDDTAVWSTFSLVLLGVLGFALLFRPFRSVNLAVVLGVFAGIILYMYIGGLTDPAYGILQDPTVRAVLSFIVAVLVFTSLNFIEELTSLINNVLNAWPVLLILGILAVAEATAIFMDTTLLDFISEYI